ncbi:MAG: thiamine phosphate synthase [Novosphingobium sp.]
MARCYSDGMMPRQSLPNIWLISDARNDAALAEGLRDLPRGSGLVFRHYHLDDAARKARFAVLLGLSRNLGHLAVLADHADRAHAWGADGVYGPPDKLDDRPALLRLAAVHDAHEVLLANRAGVDAMFLSPVHATRSHPGAEPLGADRFHALAAQADSPVIALGGMNAARAAALGWPRWAGIDAFLR